MEYERPFLSGLYRFLAIEGPDVIRPLPGYVLLRLKYLEHALSTRHHISCATRVALLETALRGDAQAGDGTAGVGAWLPRLDENGNVSTRRSPWLAVR